MDNQENQQPSPPDLSSQPPVRSKKKIYVIACVVLVIILAAVHLMMKEKAAATETSRETPNGTVVTSIPVTSSTTVIVPPEIVKDKSGKEYLTGEIIVVFKQNVSVDTAQALVVSHGGEVKQHFTNIPVFLVGIKGKGADGVATAIRTFSALPEVDHAEPNFITGAAAQ